MQKLLIRLSNVHCGDCEDTIRSILSRFFELADATDERADESSVELRIEDKKTVNLTDRNGRLGGLPRKIAKKLESGGFEVLSWDLFDDDQLVMSSESDKPSKGTAIRGLERDLVNHFGFFIRRRERKLEAEHLKHCRYCRSEAETSSSDEDIKFVVDKPFQEYRAVFSVSGMTCASCVQSVSSALATVMESNGMLLSSEDQSFSVSLLQHSAVAIVSNKQVVNKIVDAINDCGFTCQLVELLPVHRSTNTRVNAVIGGITCAACVSSIENAVKDLPFVLESGINVVTKTGQFVLDAGDNSNIDKLKSAVEDCGFDFEMTSKELINYTLSTKKSRTINVSVDKMFCSHCPEVVTDYLTSFGDAVVIQDPITLKKPFIKFTYVPNLEKNINLRRFLFDLNHIHPTDSEPGYKILPDKEGSFNCKYIEKVSVDEHLRRLSQKETKRILLRLVLATVVAIPTLIFGVIAMSLLSKTNAFRKWVEEPIWAGNVSRVVWILFIISTPVYLFAADVFHRKAYKEVKSLWFHKNSWKKRLFRFGSMNLLMCLGTSIAYFASLALLILSSRQEKHTLKGLHTTYFDSVVFLTFFLLIGRLLESYSKNKTAEAISLLNTFRATEATLVECRDRDESPQVFQNDQKIDVKLLEIDDFIRVSAGESPPVDCVIADGESSFDESALTGESVPVKHSVGHQVFSGTVNVGHSSVVARITSLEGDSLIDQIVDTVRNGQLRKAPIEKTADLITGFFVPIITFLAVVTWIIWMSLGFSGVLPDNYLDIDIGGWAVWSMEFAIAVFVIACPCGIGLAAPTALFVGSGLAAKYGILAKGGGVAFQDGAKVNVVCFDKTGTLTNGQLEVTDFRVLPVSELGPESSKKIAFQLARDMELSSNHPIAEAVVKFASKSAKSMGFSLEANKTPQVENLPGKGLRAKIRLDANDSQEWAQFEGGEAILGNEALLRGMGVDPKGINDQLEKWKGEGKSVVLVGIRCRTFFGDDKTRLLLTMACRDDVRVETPAVISYLQEKRGIECWMISGDNRQTAEAVGREVGIRPEHIISEVAPQDKEAKIKQIQTDPSKVVAMVGDGVNDAPSLAAAQVGVALSSGADLAVTSSDFILLSKSRPLEALVTLLDLSRTVFNRVKFNFGWALVYNIAGVPIAAGVIYPYHQSRLNPVWASAAMAASSVSVVMSSVALKVWQPKRWEKV